MTDAARGHDEALPGGVQELARELGDLLRGGLGLGLARLGALRELVPQRRLDRLFPLNCKVSKRSKSESKTPKSCSNEYA